MARASAPSVKPPVAGRPPDRGTPAAVVGPGLFRALDLGGLFTVLSDHVRLRSGFSSATLRVCGESVGTLSDPS